MQKLRKQAAFLLAPLACLALAGCGGGSGGTGLGSTTSFDSSGTTTGTGRAALDVYVTDAFSDTYKQVIATVYKIELSTDGKTFTTVFTDTKGRTLDLATLSATAELLASVTVPNGTYTQARVTFGDHLTLVTKDGVSSSVAVDSSLGTVSNGMIAITVPTPTKVTSGTTSALFVDFKLAEFKIAGNVLRPQIGCGDGSGFGGRRRMGHLSGTISGLTATGFTLTNSDSRTVTVAISSTTTITSGQTGKTVTLADGQSVMVEGSYDATTKTLTATSVTLNDYTSFSHERATGTVASVDAANSKFVLTVQRADGLKPTGGTIVVTTDANTRFGKGPKTTATIADVTEGSAVDVGGVFDVPTQTLAAKFVGLRPTDAAGNAPFGPGGGPGHGSNGPGGSDRP